MIKISVIIAAYNCEKYMARCIDSVRMQQGDDFTTEIIVVNDGSTDGTPCVLASYTDIRVITIPNSGVARARNIGLTHATGSYVMFLDADDFLKPDALKILVEYRKRHACDIIRFRYELVYDQRPAYIPTEAQTKQVGPVSKEDFRKAIYPLFIDGIQLNSVCMAMFRRSILDGMAFREDMKTAEDAVFSLHAYTKAHSALFLEDVLYCYYQTDQGLTGKGLALWQKYKDNYTLSAEILKHLKQWGLWKPRYIIAAGLRPVKLTIDKLKREKIRSKK